MTTLKPPPGPKGYPIIGNLPALSGGNELPTRYFRQVWRDYGDLVRIPIGPKTLYVASHPDLLREVLVTRYQEFEKPPTTGKNQNGLSILLGEGILTAQHEDWKPQRKLMQPFMHAKEIEDYRDTMAAYTDAMLESWGDGDEINISEEMMLVTMKIITRTMFGIDLEVDDRFATSATRGQELVVKFVKAGNSPISQFIRRGLNRQIKDINSEINDMMNEIIARRRDNPADDHDDLLTQLLNARYEDGSPMSDKLIRDNMVTMFMAGHETTANSLSWTLYYLDQYPDIREKLEAEVDSVLGGRTPTLEDMRQLPYTLQVIKEAMRYRPVISQTLRFPTHDTELGGYAIKAGNPVFLAIYNVHFHPDFWDAPEVFDPEHFSPEREGELHKYAYMPFGAGPRVCIGNHFAMMEAQLILAAIVGRYRVTLSDDSIVEPEYLVATRPGGGKLQMKVALRQGVMA